jgi:hypothetical protein
MSLILDGTNGLSDVDGSAATPAIRGSDANTGVFFGSDVVGLSTGGSERVRVDASGNVGIGTSSPSQKLDVVGSTTTIGRVATTADSIASLEVSRNNGAVIARLQTATSEAWVGSANNVPFAFRTNNTERARIDSSGNLLVNTTTQRGSARQTIFQNSLFLTGDGLAIQDGNSSTGGAFIGFFQEGGTKIGTISRNGASTVAYNTSSDYRLKHDIQPMTGALATVAQLKPVTYKWNVDDSDSQGFIAHELQEVVPECVTGEKDAVDAEGNPQYQGIDTSFLVATLTAALQEAHGLIKDLQARVDALEAK